MKNTHTHTRASGKAAMKGRCACLCLGCGDGRATHHYSSHTDVFTQGCGPAEKTFRPRQLSFFQAETRRVSCDITPAESSVGRCRVSLGQENIVCQACFGRERPENGRKQTGSKWNGGNRAVRSGNKRDLSLSTKQRPAGTPGRDPSRDPQQTPGPAVSCVLWVATDRLLFDAL